MERNSTRILLLDTSHIIMLSDDYNSKKREKRNKALQFLSFINSKNICIYVTMEHVCEICQIGSKDCVHKRISVFRAIKTICILNSLNRNDWLGSSVDLLAYEIEYNILYPGVDSGRKFQSVRLMNIDYMPGYYFVLLLEYSIEKLISFSVKRVKQNRFISSLFGFDLGYGDKKVKSFQGGVLRDKNSILPWINTTKSLAAQHVAKLGDKRIDDFQGDIDDFGDELLGIYDVIRNIGCDPYHALLQSFGVEESEISDDMTIKELSLHCVLKSRVDIALRLLGVERKVFEASCNNVIVFMILLKQLFSEYNMRQRRSSGDIVDRMLITHGFVCDWFTVDKRSFDLISKIVLKNDVINSTIGRPLGARCYYECIKQLSC